MPSIVHLRRSCTNEALAEPDFLGDLDALNYHQAIVNRETVKYFVGQAGMPKEYHEDPDGWLKEFYSENERHENGVYSKHIFVWVASSVG